MSDAAPFVDGRCNAKLRGARAGRFCTQYPVAGRKRCRMHGGATPRGPESVHFKDGRSLTAERRRELAATRKHALAAIAVMPASSLRDRLGVIAVEIGEGVS